MKRLIFCLLLSASLLMTFDVGAAEGRRNNNKRNRSEDEDRNNNREYSNKKRKTNKEEKYVNNIDLQKVLNEKDGMHTLAAFLMKINEKIDDLKQKNISLENRINDQDRLLNKCAAKLEKYNRNQNNAHTELLHALNQKQNKETKKPYNFLSEDSEDTEDKSN